LAVFAIALYSCDDEDGTDSSGKALVSIAITKQPTKTAYKVDEKFDPAGMEVTATYDDETTAPVNVTASMITYDFSLAGTKTVTVTYKEKTATVNVTVTATGIVGKIDPNLVGSWSKGTSWGGMYDPVTGRYIGTSGTGVIYTYNNDGTYSNLVIAKGQFVDIHNWSYGNYSAENGIIKKTNRLIERSSDGGKTVDPPVELEDYQEFYLIDGDKLITSDNYPNPYDDEYNYQMNRVML
jgi:hypothetical protein